MRAVHKYFKEKIVSSISQLHLGKGKTLLEPCFAAPPSCWPIFNCHIQTSTLCSQLFSIVISRVHDFIVLFRLSCQIIINNNFKVSTKKYEESWKSQTSLWFCLLLFFKGDSRWRQNVHDSKRHPRPRVPYLQLPQGGPQRQEEPHWCVAEG